MRYHLFLHYGRFLQNVGKGCVRANMHTTVYSRKKQKKLITELKKSWGIPVKHWAVNCILYRLPSNDFKGLTIFKQFRVLEGYFTRIG